MLRKSLSISLVTTCFFMIGCDSFSTQTYTPQQIKKASEWSAKDQYPRFESCYEEDMEENFQCFKNTIVGAVENSLYDNNFVANQEIDEELVLHLIVDESGLISLKDVEGGSYVYSVIPDLSSVIEMAIDNLPEATPAMKTNVEAKVKSSIKLPIRVRASLQ